MEREEDESRDVVRVSERQASIAWSRSEIAGTTAAKADTRLTRDPGAGFLLAGVACRQGHRRSASGECRSRGQNTKSFFGRDCACSEEVIVEAEERARLKEMVLLYGDLPYCKDQQTRPRRRQTDG